MKRQLLTGAALLAATMSMLGGLAGAATGKPYIGSWKAKLTADQLLDNGIVQPKMRGTWRLELNGDGTYRTYNPWDRWLSGTYSANATRIVFSKDIGCLQAGLKGPGIYRWKITQGKLKLTSIAIGSDPCGGRWQTVSIPFWMRA
jgi:hypothetical protein